MKSLSADKHELTLIDLRASVKVFVKELSSRIELLSSDKATENVDKSNYQRIMNLLARFGIVSREDLTEDNIRRIDKRSITKLLTYAGQSDEFITYVSKHKEDFSTKIKEIVIMYINEYNYLDQNQGRMIKEKIELYQKYIDYFTSTDNFLFEEQDELIEVMSKLGLSDEDKKNILRYVGEMNIRNNTLTDINIRAVIDRLYEKVEKYIEDDKIKQILQTRFAESETDIDLIPTIAEELSYEINLDKDIITNIIVVSIATSLEQRLDLIDSDEDKEEILAYINDTLSYQVDTQDQAVYTAKKIMAETSGQYYEALKNGITEEMINEYLENPITVIEEDVETRGEAIDLKELAVLKPLYETLSSIIDLEVDSPEYKKAADVLTKLNEQYYLLESKKEEVAEVKKAA